MSDYTKIKTEASSFKLFQMMPRNLTKLGEKQNKKIQIWNNVPFSASNSSLRRCIDVSNEFKWKKWIEMKNNKTGWKGLAIFTKGQCHL